MGGTSTTSQQQSSTTAPWSAAQPSITGILGQLNGLIPNSGLNSTESGALNTLQTNAAAGNPYNSQIAGLASNLLGGGGATNQAGAVNQNYQNYYSATNPLASNTNYDPMSTPGLGTQLAGLNNSILSSVNGQFAAAGRDGSPANSQAAAYGLAQGEAPLITQQYNQNVQNQQGAAGNLYNAGNTNSGILSGLQQQGLTNQIQGVSTSQDALNAMNYTPQQQLALAQLAQSIPAQNLSLLAQIGVPIAGLGSQSTGQSTGTSTESGAQQFAQLLGGIGSLGNLWNTKSSDARLKEDIRWVGTLDNGLPVYLYRYKQGGPFEIGLMAQDVEKVTPEAVTRVNGFKVVNYKMAMESA